MAHGVDLEAERSVLGALLVIDGVQQVIAELHLEPSHFYSQHHAATFAAMVAVVESNRRVDAITVADELGRRGQLEEIGGRDAISELASMVAVPGNYMHHAEIVVRKAEWRQRMRGAKLAQEAIEAEDPAKLAEAEALLGTEIKRSSSLYDVEDQREVLWSLLEGQAKAEFGWPFDRLNMAAAGGMRRGQLNIVAGYTGDGKSQFADQILDLNAKRGHRVALYDNEMTVEERVARRATRLLGVSHSALVNGSLSEAESQTIVDRISTIEGWPMIEVPGWTPEEVAHHVRRHRWDLVLIDILHNFRFADERELSSAVSTFKAMAGEAKCCVVLTAHINRGGIERGRRRPPTRHDLRWSGDIENLAHTICFVHRKQDHTVEPPMLLPDGDVYFDKCRGGQLTSVPSMFNERRLRWEAISAQQAEANEAARRRTLAASFDD